ncbi:hypothetical protein EV198_1686 [Roseivirga ehrenbergii]|nr:hypothetical protein EV198_1686 [Roseivirga ehrenbergii]
MKTERSEDKKNVKFFLIQKVRVNSLYGREVSFTKTPF